MESVVLWDVRGDSLQQRASLPAVSSAAALWQCPGGQRLLQRFVGHCNSMTDIKEAGQSSSFLVMAIQQQNITQIPTTSAVCLKTFSLSMHLRTFVCC